MQYVAFFTENHRLSIPGTHTDFPSGLLFLRLYVLQFADMMHFKATFCFITEFTLLCI